MKVLWIVNTIFPAPSKVLGLTLPTIGGWMYGLAEKVSKSDNIELVIATVYSGNKIEKVTFDGMDYFLLPCKNNINYDKKIEFYWQEVVKKVNPDIIHIHGTEFSHGLACMRVFPDFDYVVSIQGLVDVYTKYFLGGISFWDVVKNMTFRDILRNDNLFQAKKKFKKRGILEMEYFQRTKHVIGRTQWDFTHARALNAKAKYHFCNESLRDNFYEAVKWDFSNKNNFSIFCSQAVYPLKGLHQVLKAISLLKHDFPDIKLNIAGTNITNKKTLIDKVKISGYGFYLNRLIKEFELEKIVVFTGSLDENQMIKAYQGSHVFICSSSIENSPNSLGEAQLIGVPSIASYVGGIPNMIEESKTGLMYRFEEFEMLAENIRKIFTDDCLAKKISENGIRVAEERHNQITNLNQTINIYNSIKH